MTPFGSTVAFRGLLGATLTLLLLPGVSSNAAAQEAPRRHGIVRHAHSGRPAGGRVLTVHRRFPRYATIRRGEPGFVAPALLRRWNDPDLYSFGGWRIGGDSFYGDGAGDPITRGNASLSMISGYGGARGGYGGPHFDSVGGFHNGPGPDAQEDADYASGSISTPYYGDILPRYPSLKQRVATLNAGVVSNGSARLARMHLTPAATAVSIAPRQRIDPGPRPLPEDDLFPDLGIDAF